MIQDEAVKKQFQKQLNIYTKREQGTKSYLIPLVLDWLSKQKSTRRVDICEFGGASGQLLSVVEKKYPKHHYTVSEIVPEYRDHLVSKKFKFELRSILNSGFDNNSFDVIIMRDLFHHLVSNNLSSTRKIQQKAVRELKRLIRPNGAIFVEELTLRPRIVGKLIFAITRLNSLLGIKLPSLSLDPNTIVYFLSPKELESDFFTEFGQKKVKKNIISLPMGVKDYIAHLGGKTEKTLITTNT